MLSSGILPRGLLSLVMKGPVRIRCYAWLLLPEWTTMLLRLMVYVLLLWVVIDARAVCAGMLVIRCYLWLLLETSMRLCLLIVTCCALETVRLRTSDLTVSGTRLVGCSTSLMLLLAGDVRVVVVKFLFSVVSINVFMVSCVCM